MEKKILLSLSTIATSFVIGCLTWLMINVSELKGDMKLVMYQLTELHDSIAINEKDFQFTDD
tara:strand:+ start:31 stop:216 length:186 start_codon:yes stop_codon:yes gene_type:complete